MKKAVVTGANGFIGTALCRALSEKGTQVIAVVRDEKEGIAVLGALPGIRIVGCDLAEFGELADRIPDRDVDVLYHLAWVGSAGPLRGDYQVQLDNVRYACDTMLACKEMQCSRFVFASSIMEYEIGAVMETDGTPGINTLYSTAKLSADYMIRTLAGSLEIQYIRAVISNIYGPGETSPRLVNTSLRKLLRGEHCAFSPGEQTYDFIYIDDAARAFVALGERGRANRTYYVGSLKPRPLKEFLRELRDQVDPEIPIGLGELPFNGVSLTYREFDVQAVKKDTGFEPEISFGEGIRRTIEWIRGSESCRDLNFRN